MPLSFAAVKMQWALHELYQAYLHPARKLSGSGCTLPNERRAEIHKALLLTCYAGCCRDWTGASSSCPKGRACDNLGSHKPDQPTAYACLWHRRPLDERPDVQARRGGC